jgi:transposase
MATPSFTIIDFMKKFPNDDVCLETIFQSRYGKAGACPKCGVLGGKFYRVSTRRCYRCGDCDGHIYPIAGTVMEGSNTEITKWLYGIYLFSVSKNGVSAKELGRSLGISYPTAHTMGHKIRSLMDDKKEFNLSGKVEVDESLIGGKSKGGKRGWGAMDNKVCLFSMVERGGRVKTYPVENRKGETLIPLIKENVEKGTMINSDEYKGYNSLESEGFGHDSVVHSKYQWTKGETHTQSVEGMWGNRKKNILSVYTKVQPHYMQSYMNEYDFRYNRREKLKKKESDEQTIFEELVERLCQIN